jgi:hypothetical protein
MMQGAAWPSMTVFQQRTHEKVKKNKVGRHGWRRKHYQYRYFQTIMIIMSRSW